MKFRRSLRIASMVCVATALVTMVAEVRSAPVSKSKNVVLFVTDDMGQDAGCYGNPVIKTPHLDALARAGTRFPNARSF